jgi:hypothetical protein
VVGLVSNQSRDAELHLRARSCLAPEIQLCADAFRPFVYSCQPPMPITPAGLKDFRVDAFSVIADMYAEQVRVVTNLSFDLG